MDKFIVPGFPTEVSETIEAPDIAELLCYPMFQAASIETVMEYGSEWQKKIVNSLPIQGGRRFITILAMPSLMMPNMRALTTLPESDEGDDYDPDREWHIDGNEERSHEHIFPTDTCHLYLAHTSKPTEFNVNPIEITDRDIFMKNRIGFCQHMSNNARAYNLQGRKAELNKIYTFSNHLHRAMVPDRVEFRYSIRVRETDQEYIKPGIKHQFLSGNRYNVPGKTDYGSNIRYSPNGDIILTPPANLRLIPDFILNPKE